MIPDVPIDFIDNPRAAGESPLPDRVRHIFAEADGARAEIRRWPGYSPSPLRKLPALADSLGIGALYAKDESRRFDLGSFKSLGGAYAVYRIVAEHVARITKQTPDSRELASGGYREYARQLTVACASAGNHGRAVAWGAQLFGCSCTVYLDESVSDERAAAIGALGARVQRTTGGYDHAVRQVAADAEAQGWIVVSDTAYPGYTEIPAHIMAGYTLIVDEVAAVLDDITHVFVQAGVGSLAAAVCAEMWGRYGAARPRFIVVEPSRAACFAASIASGKSTLVRDPTSIMGGLNCGVASTLAWEVLEHGADAAITIEDAAVGPVLALLARPLNGDPRILAGESGCAGIAGAIGTTQNDQARRSLGLTTSSRVLTIISEGPNDPLAFESLSGVRSGG